jgi:hypothetical protein
LANLQDDEPRYCAARADAGPFKGDWVVIEIRTGKLAIDGSFACRHDAEFTARFHR